MVTDSDRRMIDYFITEKGDIERWAGWDERKEDIAKAYPELLVALTNLKVAKITLRAIVKQIESDITEE